MSDAKNPRHSATERTSWLTPERRHWIYRVLIAVLALLAFYGVLSDQEIPLYVGLIGAILGLGTADLHVPRDDTDAS